MTKTTKSSPKKSSKKNAASKTKAAKASLNNQALAKSALALALINALFAVLFVAIIGVLYITLPGGNSTVAEVIGWILLAINVAVTPFLAIAALIMAGVSIKRRTNRMQSVTAICIVLLSGLMFVSAWGLSIS